MAFQDFQINNLVKLEKSNEVKDIKESFIKILDNDPSIKNYEFLQFLAPDGH